MHLSQLHDPYFTFFSHLHYFNLSCPFDTPREGEEGCKGDKACQSLHSAR